MSAAIRGGLTPGPYEKANPMAYKSHPVGAMTLMTIGAVILAFGVMAFAHLLLDGEVGASAIALAIAGFGLLCGLCGWACLIVRVIVDPHGLTLKGYFSWAKLTVPWDSIKYWLVNEVTRGYYAGTLYAEFHAGGRNGPVVVREWEVVCPGFEIFIEDVRSHAGRKERVTQQTQPLLDNHIE
jgi:hypothetical protein